ncbi:MAG: T9SS type A sorting domain-containing protein [Bacteroidota bacterium]|nr:T9SS type A sorting domain-containing protein [Bacteroidota bacterium]MDP4231845.1 T9SS type A sorting domain-containing protein [Bacteroidota bacterium]MDP4287182.1 T9SS type A sorting domain-containing protein [Bacteroidota bacterium]
MQQLDSSNAVAVGDSGNIFRTVDAGVTWKRQTPPQDYSAASLWGVHFHDPMNGIVGAADRPLTTSDGGEHWTLAPLTRLAIQGCHCYGPGKFAVLSELTGQIYRTSDNWATIDSTPPIPETVAQQFSLRRCNFGDGDTIIAYGFDSKSGLIVRTLDGGRTWEKCSLPDAFYTAGPVIAMTPISDDTLIAGCDCDGKLLYSTDLAHTWQFDTVPISNGFTASANGVGRPSPGVIVASMPMPGGPGFIVRGTLATAGVQLDHTLGIAGAYPNPANESVTLTFIAPDEPVHVLDVLGRELLQIKMPQQGPLSLNIASLPAGIYFAQHGRERARFVKE